MQEDQEGSAFQCSYTEKEVESLGIIELSEILENNTINYDNLETEKEMRELVCTLMKKGKQPTEKLDNTKMTFKTDASQQGAKIIEKILEKDMERKKKLHNLYCDLERFMANDHVDSELKQEMRTEFGDVLEEIKTYKEELMQEECPIVVAGETTAGKSSLLNLLLGSDVLPHSLLTCTTTICRLWNKEEKAVLVTDADDEVTRLHLPKDMEAALMKEKLQNYVSDASQNKYKFVDIHWPIPILKRQAIIVDTPGIGSSDELTMRLLDYLPKAIAFIYVINSSNAGGVQSDRLLKIFEVQKKDSKMYEFDPTRAIFVCNKWDQVPAEEDDKVWNNTKMKLKDNWPHFKESQMFKLSSKEETRRAATPGLEYTTNFQRLLTGIGEMIPASLEAKVARHSRWQKQFLEKALKRIVGRIKLSRKTEDEKKKLKVNIEERIKTLSYSIKEVKKRVKEEAEFRCEQISTNLYEHLRSKETYKYMFLWSNAELPKGGDFEVIEYQAKKLIIERINTETRAWCNREKVNDITQELSNLFKAECKLIDAQCEEINRTLLDISMPLDDGLHDYSNKPEHSNDPLFTRHEKIVLAVTSPLWLPLVIGAGLIALPFGVAAGVKDLVQQSWKINDYNSNRLKYMMDWCSEVLKQYNKEAILKLMEETYLKDFKMKVDFVCETVIPQQIKADEQFICHIKNELRTSCEIRKQFQPLEFSCKSILGKLLLINMDYFSGYKLSKKNIRNGGEEIGKGQFSDVHATEVLINEKWIKAAVKTLRKPLEKTDSYVQLSEVQNLRKLYHPNIVELFGVSYRLGSQSKKFLQIYMEYCDGSLEHIVYRKRDPPPCFKFKDVSECKESWEFYLKMMCGVCKGLIHVHYMGFVHRDLKLANILVKDGEAKIADIGLAKEAEDILGTVTGTPTTMAPEVLQGKMYGTEADIFSLGIILWEMWYARPGYTHPVGVESEGYQFIAKNLNELSKYVINGTRPELETKYRPHNKLQFLMKKCWDNSIVNRPTAAKVLHKLSEMKS
ncbi:uncharacterized protein LOC134706836 [Mytilus trossulus]|uniref:uncharacterized protein LOC134706836 n=1 Tax=Mytilus trossulus TaxID=6551 RepID=UPI0030060410